MELREIGRILRASWWLPVVGMLVLAVAALGLSLVATPQYTAQSQLFVSSSQSSSPTEALTGSQFSQQRVSSYARLLTGDDLAARVVERLGLTTSPRDLADQVQATAVTDTVLIDLRVTDESPQRARDIAEAIGVEFRDMVSELETPLGESVPPVKVSVTQSPQVPDEASSPQTVRNVLLGAVAGLLLGAGIAVARARLDRSVKEAEQIEGLAGAPVIGTILRDDSFGSTHVIERGGSQRVAEDYRQLRNNIQFLNVDDPPRTFLVTSALPSEGKTTAVVNLGLALADAGRSVVIVEADLRRPKVTSYLRMVEGVGLTNILSGSADLDDVLQEYSDRGLSVIAAGPTPPNPGELLASSQMAALIGKLRGRFEYVLVDGPPLLPVADSSGFAATVDGVLVSVRYGSTTREQFQQATATLHRVDAKVLGVVLNIVPQKAATGDAYGYGHEYGYAVKRDG